jgi:hypothetical protein
VSFDILYVDQLRKQLIPAQAQYEQARSKRDFFLKLLAFHCQLIPVKSDQPLTEEEATILLNFLKILEDGHTNKSASTAVIPEAWYQGESNTRCHHFGGVRDD